MDKDTHENKVDRKGEICLLNVKVLFINHNSISHIQRILGGIFICMFASVCMHIVMCAWHYYSAGYMHRFPKASQQHHHHQGSPSQEQFCVEEYLSLTSSFTERI